MPPVDSLLAALPLLLFRARVAADLLEHLPRVAGTRLAGVTASDLEAASDALEALANAARELAEVRRRDRR